MKRLVLILFIGVLCGCGGEPASRPTPRSVSGGNTAAQRGETLFTTGAAGEPACSTCHSLDTSTLVGPGMAGIGERAGKRVSGQSASQYLHNSILHPADYLVEGYADVMPKTYAEALSSQQIDDLVAYLLTLR